MSVRRTARTVSALVLLCASAYADDAAAVPSADELRAHAKALEERIDRLERESPWPLAEVRRESPSALDAAVRSLHVGGYMEFQYGFNLRHGGGVDGERGDTLNYTRMHGSAGDDNGFSFQNVQLLVDKPPTTENSVGFRVRTDFGRVAQFDNRDPNFNAGGTAFDVREAYMTLRTGPLFTLTNDLDVTVGRFDSYLGLETPDNTDPRNYGLVTRNPLHTLVTPITHTGVTVAAPWRDGGRTTVGFVNGWDVVRDPNDSKTWLFNHETGDLGWLHSRITLNQAYGNEGSIPRAGTTVPPDGNKTRMNELIWTGEFDPSTRFALDLAWYRADNSTRDANGTRFNSNTRSGTAYLQHFWTKDAWTSVRYGYFSDQPDGFPVKFRLTEFSVALGCTVAADLTMAIELRHEKAASSAGVFLDSSGNPTDRQDTLTASWLYRF